MQIQFNDFLLLEKLGINDDVIKLSEIVYSNIQNGITEFNLPKNKLGINKIIIEYDNNIDAMGKNISDSTKDTIVLNINPNLKINKGMIYHEMNHVLQFVRIGKEKSKKKLDPLMSMELTMFNTDFQIKILKDFIRFNYYLQKDEIDSYVYNSYYELKKYISINKIDNENIDKTFSIIIKLTMGYKILNYLKDYNVDDLKNIDNKILVNFINTIDKNNKLILKYTLENIESVLDTIKKGLLPSEYQIKNIDTYLNKIKKKQKESIKYLNKKLFRLKDLLINENDPMT